MVTIKVLESYTFNDSHTMANLADIVGLIVPFLHINHLIANKKAVNIPKDQLDVFYLEKIKKIQEENQSEE